MNREQEIQTVAERMAPPRVSCPRCYRVLPPGVACAFCEEEPTKVCPRCAEEKALSAFSPDASRSDGRSSWCRKCRAEDKKIRIHRETTENGGRIVVRAMRRHEVLELADVEGWT